MYENGMNNINFDSSVVGNNNVVENDMNVDINMMDNNSSMMMPMNEGAFEKVVHKTYCYEVPHICPIHTKVINHHVYKHTYKPCYTCSEENVISNIQCGSCSQFR